MNWLAHIYLADINESEDILGNFLGDFLVNIHWQTFYSKMVKQGIRTHLAVDKFVGLNAIFQQSCNRIAPQYGHYNTILIDVFYDHFLARDWHNYSNVALEPFVARFYAILHANKQILPGKLIKILPALSGENWLVSYRERTGVERALIRLSERITQPNTFYDGIKELDDKYALLERDFQLFFPKLVEYVKDFRNQGYESGDAI